MCANMKIHNLPLESEVNRVISLEQWQEKYKYHGPRQLQKQGPTQALDPESWGTA